MFGFLTEFMTIDILVGMTMESVSNESNQRIVFRSVDGREFALYHIEDCCESVTVDDICGDLSDLVGSPILQAEETTSKDNPAGVAKEYQDSFTWTFYRLATIKGQVVIRWYGESNGYYSESVDFVETGPWDGE